MTDYWVLARDGERLGYLVATHGRYLLFERGTLFKVTRAAPRQGMLLDDEAAVIRLAYDAKVVKGSPRINPPMDDGCERLLDEYYGLEPELVALAEDDPLARVVNQAFNTGEAFWSPGEPAPDPEGPSRPVYDKR